MRRGPGTQIMSILRCEALTRTYPSGGREITVLRDITFELEAGRILAITGPSGSGKSTLLGLMAGLDRPTRGRVLLDGRDLGALSEDQRARLRAETVGFVFQSFHLIPTLTARENVQVPLELRGEDGRGARRRAAAAGRPRGPRAPLPRPALGRRAAARRGGAGLREPAQAAVRGRAHRQPRRRERAQRGRAARGAEPRARHDDRARDPRARARRPRATACCGCATGPWSRTSAVAGRHA